MLHDLEARDRFKASQPALRQKKPGSQSLRLFEIPGNQGLSAERSSARAFGERRVTFGEISGLLSCLRQISLNGKPKQRWGSAGGLYPVQIYLYAKPERVEDLPAGTYYYHPVEHCLIPIMPGAWIGEEVQTWMNQSLYEQSAFSLFLVGQLSAIAPLYGDASQNFCLLEAGLITQVLETTAPAFHIGLCQVGG